MITVTGNYTDADVMLDEVEDGVLDQIQTLVDHEAFQNPVSIMPDTHVGAGAVIGFTMPVGDRVVPNTIGVDIGCGMYAANFGEQTYMSHEYERWDAAIRERVPLGFEVHDDQPYHIGDDFPWAECEERLAQFDLDIESPGYDIDYFKDLCQRVGYDPRRAIDSLGSLGGGNHFIELGRSVETNGSDLWCIIHSGSRGIGLNIAQHHQERAVELRENEDIVVSEWVADEYLPYVNDDLTPKADKIRADFEGEAIGAAFDSISTARGNAIGNVDENLAYLEGEEAHQYYIDMVFAQMYASESRKEMMRYVGEAIGSEPVDTIESVHNFIDFRDSTIRKGATRAHEGDRAVIPFNMRDGTLLVEGKGNENWNRSAPHGAGRVMSRTQAYNELDVEEFKSQMEMVVSSSVGEATLDEAPGAYKSASLIEDAIEPTAEVVDRLVPVLNIKAE